MLEKSFMRAFVTFRFAGEMFHTASLHSTPEDRFQRFRVHLDVVMYVPEARKTSCGFAGQSG